MKKREGKKLRASLQHSFGFEEKPRRTLIHEWFKRSRKAQIASAVLMVVGSTSGVVFAGPLGALIG